MFEQNLFGSFLSIVFSILGFLVMRNELREIDKHIASKKDIAPAIGCLTYMGCVVLLYAASFIPRMGLFFSLLALGLITIIWPIISIVYNGYKNKATFKTNGFTHWDKNIIVVTVTYECIFSTFHSISSIVEIWNFLFPSYLINNK